MRSLLKYIKPYRLQFVLAPLLKLLEAVFELFVPFVMTAIIDRGIKTGDDGFVLLRGGVLILLAVVGLSVAITAQYFSAYTATGFACDVRHDLYKHSMALSSEAVDKIGEATLITRLTGDVNQVETGLNLFLRLFLRSPFIVFGAMVMAFFIDINCGLIFAGVIVILALVVTLCLKFSIPGYNKVQSKTDILTDRTRDFLSGVRVVRAFNATKREQNAFSDDNNNVVSAQTKVGRISSLMNPITLLTVNIGIIVLIKVGGIKVETGNLTQGQIVALINYMSMILVELVKLANLTLQINRALASADRIEEVFLLPTETHNTSLEKCFDGINIKADNLSFRYPNGNENALNDISFDLKTGETLGIIGGTGSGKSTLLSLILGFYKPESDKLCFDNKSYNDVDIDSLRKITGYVPQRAAVFSGTVDYNLFTDEKTADNDDINKALIASQADGVVSEKGGLSAECEAYGRNFSGGQKQRLNIARALVKNPKLLVLDDAFSALDTATEKKVRESIHDIQDKNNTTVIIVSQRISSVKNADHILVLDDGNQVGYGTHDELMNSCEVYREIARIGGGA